MSHHQPPARPPAKFPTGSVVRLISGGPAMTVNRRGQYGEEVECVWFNGTQDDSGVHWSFGKAWIGEGALELVPIFKRAE